MQSQRNNSASEFLSEVIGHGAWKRYFAEAIRAEQLAHAYLLLGPAGAGKWTFVRALVARILCIGPGGSACGTCGPCLRFAAGTHPDITLLDVVEEGERGLGVEAARERVVDAFRLRPHEAPYRIVAINDAERMESAAQNALLKTLEEPPPRSLLFLVAASTNGLLDTVLSRCFLLRFGPVPADELRAALRARGLGEHDADNAIQLANGLPGFALAATGDADRLPAVARKFLAGQLDAEGASRELAAFSEELREKSAFERRRRAGLTLCAALAAEGRNQLMVDSNNVRPQHLLARVAEAARELLAHGTPELAIDRLLDDLKK
jgi:DNA polymerase-3 subunit delta'